MKSYPTFYTIIAVLFTHGTIPGTATGCEGVKKCPCFESTRDPGTLNINCSGMGLTIIPRKLPAKVLSIDFSDNFVNPDRLLNLCHYQLHTVSLARNHLSRLPENQFVECGVIDTLDMSGNEFDHITGSSLSGLHALRSLIGIESRNFSSDTFTDLTSLRHLKIVFHQSGQSIPTDLFKDIQLENLEIVVKGALELPVALFDTVANTLNTLTITSNSLRWIDPNQLNKLVSLKKFSLTCYTLRSIPEKSFRNNKNLKTISLTVTSVPRNIFRNLNNLVSLKLYGLEDMPSELFEGLFSLISLEVSKSTIPQIPDGWFLDLYNLEELLLTSNKIAELKEVDFKNLHSVKTLDISRNSIRELNNGVVAEIAETVEHVNLSDNFLKTISARNLAGASNLETLDLSKNQLYKIENVAFQDMHKLQILNLGHNKLFEIPEESFASNGMLISLDLSDNIFSTIPEGLFKTTPLLKTLDLSGNNLRSTGPASVYPVQVLSHVDFSYNLIRCDCDSYELVLDIPDANVHGECQEPDTGIPIKDFKPEEQCSNIPASATATSRSSSSIYSKSPSSPITDFYSSVRNNTVSPATEVVSRSKSGNNDDTSTVIITTKYSLVDKNDSGISTETTRSSSSINSSSTSPPSPVSDIPSFIPNVRKGTAVSAKESVVRSKSERGDNATTWTTTTKSAITSKLDSRLFIEIATSSPGHTLSDSVTSDKPFITTLPNESYKPLSVRLKTESTYTTVQTPPLQRETSDKTRTPTTKQDIGTRDRNVMSISVTHGNDRTENGTLSDGNIQLSDRTGIPKLNNSIPHVHPNLTADAGEVIVYHPVTDESHHIAIASIVGVGLVSALIVIVLLYKRRRRSRYEVRQVLSATQSEVEINVDFKPPKEVPSIQIETVDAADNVKVEIYQPQ